MCASVVSHRPEDTMWESGTFHLLIKFTEDYPTSPPIVRFLTRMYHPNIYLDGKICLDILQNQWSAMYDIAAVLTSIQSLLNDPNPDSPANPQAAKILVNNRVEYDRLVLVRGMPGLPVMAFREGSFSRCMCMLNTAKAEDCLALWLSFRNASKTAGLFLSFLKERLMKSKREILKVDTDAGL